MPLRTPLVKDCFLSLYKHATEGKLKNYDTFTDICSVLNDRVQRDFSANPNAKFGMRYPPSYLQFMVLMRSYGPNSCRQYEIPTTLVVGIRAP